MGRLLHCLFLSALLISPFNLLCADKNAGDPVAAATSGQSLPGPFNLKADWERNQPAISTGYFMLNSEDPLDTPLRPNVVDLLRSLDKEPEAWHRIVSGPNQFPAEHWTTNKEGFAYFRNPGDREDSTDNAFAGPINIGFPYYFNGVRYDSFYVSSNGLIALSNRRYYYDANGERTIPEGKSTAWDSESDDTRVRNDAQNTRGVNDAVADDWGYYHVACGGDPDDPLAGIRAARNTSLDADGFAQSGMIEETPLIAAFWDDWQLPQFNINTNEAEDFGQVWYWRSADNKELTIYFVNLVPIGAKQHPDAGLPDIVFANDARTGEQRVAFTVNAHVTLNSKDSSIVVLTHKYSSPILIVNNRPVSSSAIVRQNATVGLRGQARYKDNKGEVNRYVQYTEGLRDGQVFVRETDTPHAIENVLGPNNALRFKQYQNLFRAVRIEFLMKDPQTLQYTVPVADPDNYELLIGNTLLGSFRPIVTYQNLSNDIQGVGGINYREQDARFRATLQIRNEVVQDTLVYNRSICVDSAALTNSDLTGVQLVNYKGEVLEFTGNGVPPYGFVQVAFPDFETNFQPNLVGRLRADALAQNLSCAGVTLGEEWTFDNSCSIRLHGLRVLNNFYDNVSGFHYTRRNGTIPDSYKWVSHGAEAVDGRKHTFNPPPPIDVVEAPGNPDVTLVAPVMRMNRVDETGQDLAPGGDELISFPIDLRGRSSAVLSFSYQRTGIPPANTFDRGWSDEIRIGPEVRVVEDGLWESTAPLQEPDVLELHFANPSPDSFNNIVNIPDDGWSVHPNIADLDNPIVDNPAFTVFGGGGYRRGFHEDNPDSALTRRQGLRYDSLDAGSDPAFVKAWVCVPDYILNEPSDGNRYFRFKLKVKAKDDGIVKYPRDDFDDFYIDNVVVMPPTETPDLEMSTVTIGQQNEAFPYSAFPASQAEGIPIQIKIVNNSNLPSRAFSAVAMLSEKGGGTEKIAYCWVQTLPFLRAKTETVKIFPIWNSRQFRSLTYFAAAKVLVPGGDPNPLNDITSSFYTLDFANVLAYDKPDIVGTNSAESFAETPGKGINLRAYNSGRFSSATAFGDDAGSVSGRIAVKFGLSRQDTILGYQPYFAALADNTQEVHFAIHENEGGIPAPNPLPGSFMRRERGRYDLDAREQPSTGATDDLIFGEYATYLLPKELVLPPGKYWMVISQTGQEGLELGASAYRMGMQTLNHTTKPEPGGSSAGMMLSHNFRTRTRQGELINDNHFLYVNSLFGDDWQQFTPTVGNPAYAHLDHAGEINGLRTYTRGSWIPMLRPYFGPRTWADPPIYIDPFNCPIIPPVELVSFDGEALPPRGIELYWLTASESGNAGFYVERRTVGYSAEFNSIGFVKGAGTATRQINYDLLDSKVERGTTYEYRLRQVDYDGTVEYSRSVTVEYDYADSLDLRNTPNPISESTDISFGLPASAAVRLEIQDVLGNTIRLLTEGQMRPIARTTVKWDTRDERGLQVAAGLYFCRLTVGEQTVVRMLNVVR